MIRCKFCQLAACTCGREDWEDYMTGGEAKDALADANAKIEQLQAERDELAAQVAVLLDDVTRCYRMLLSEPDTKGALFKAENILRDVTATTPPAALATLRAKHLEEAAKVCDSELSVYKAYAMDRESRAVESCVKLIRALINKETT